MIIKVVFIKKKPNNLGRRILCQLLVVHLKNQTFIEEGQKEKSLKESTFHGETWWWHIVAVGHFSLEQNVGGKMDDSSS